MSTACSVAILGLLASAAVVACSSSTGSSSAPDGGTPIETSDAAAAADSGPDTTPGFPDNHGPGAFGALPSGYCCTKDAECRNRKCLDVGTGERMCIDECQSESDCDVPKTPFGCKIQAGKDYKSCSPPAGFKCMPPGDFVRGTLAVGDCCPVTPGQRGGSECASHVCGSFGDGPDICLNRCSGGPADCAPGYKCETMGGGAAWTPTCLPLAVYSGGTYTCK